MDSIKAVGTAALRTVANGADFIEQIHKATGIMVELIDGDREAQLIYEGVSKICDASDLPALIMDVGGGSVEFIIADKKGIQWARSYPIGVAVLFQDHHKSDPISADDQQSLRAFLRPYLEELMCALQQFRPTCLIGASGTFDVLLTFLGKRVETYTVVDINQVRGHLTTIIKMDQLTRQKDQRIPSTRVDMIVVAALLIQHIIELHPFGKMSVSQYALKEGLF